MIHASVHHHQWGLRLSTETFGNADNPALLLIMGGNASAFAFPDDFCHSLADHGYQVVRYDHRGAGGSTPVDYPRESYELKDLAADAAEVICGLGLDPRSGSPL